MAVRWADDPPGRALRVRGDSTKACWVGAGLKHQVPGRGVCRVRRCREALLCVICVGAGARRCTTGLESHKSLAVHASLEMVLRDSAFGSSSEATAGYDLRTLFAEHFAASVL